ncbi:hypothetical protein J2S78_002896 [Salibacterium salarium]|uniref:hypothetical protein n=1 Tax=Salibacterium salarium TaxID=284579 RepID=UPI0027895F0C|nr:hypothetical protein [Salibacterium salarium]MDQ0300428.1 hypothetical protein [Salibacterium salarium]
MLHGDTHFSLINHPNGQVCLSFVLALHQLLPEATCVYVAKNVGLSLGLELHPALANSRAILS